MPIYGSVVEQTEARQPLAERVVGWFDVTRDDPSPGRRLRCFAALLRPKDGNPKTVTASHATTEPLIAPRRPMTYAEVMRAIGTSRNMRAAREQFTAIPLRVGITEVYTAIPEGGQRASRDADLHPALQDLANEINEDIREACEALDNPDVFYPGVDVGIEPVPDSHVELVIWALQRELNRELRGPAGGLGVTGLPAVPLAELPSNVQRALVERRRLRFQEFGIGRKQWERGEWSLWDVPEDRDWVPRRAVRLGAA